MERKFLRRLQANFQSVIMFSIAFGIGAYCGMVHNLLEEGGFIRYQAVALLVGFSAIGIGTIAFSLFYLLFGRTVRKCAKKALLRVTENVKFAYRIVCKTLEKAKDRHVTNSGIAIYSQQSQI